MENDLSFRLSRSSQEVIEARTGMTVDEISSFGIDDITSRVEKRSGKKFKVSTFSDIADQLGRGQVYAFADRLISRRFIDKNS